MRRRPALLLLPMLALAGCMTAAPPARRQPTIVFFNADSAALDSNAATLVAEAAERAKANPTLPVRVRGFTAPEGSAGYNRSLSEARARNVADVLVAAGVNRIRIVVEPRGPVPFESIPTESRRVEIVLGD
ncbi:OmpA family protein [Belnapia sp. T6]|uniref:OmpA family protein n=1 Tax=Belnapia mucosa TaxID=2804532 RepID=A0ABS1V062_9PROT|nr:OmpA family protein [Belnapia mucosa]MBL6455099.1 OmpA family protein [Belnapia mucosa]